MGTKDYSTYAAKVASKLAKYGGEASLIETTLTGGSPMDPTSGTPAKVLHKMKALETEFSRKEIAGGSVRTGDVKIMTTVPDIAPTKTLPMRWGGKDYTVESFDRIAPDGSTVIAYFWHLRP